MKVATELIQNPTEPTPAPQTNYTLEKFFCSQILTSSVYNKYKGIGLAVLIISEWTVNKAIVLAKNEGYPLPCM